MSSLLATAADRARHGDSALPPRNMLLETRLGDARADEYVREVAPVSTDVPEWRIAHGTYVDSRIRRLDDDETPITLVAEDVDSWPACFSTEPLRVTLGPERWLVSVVVIQGIVDADDTATDAVTLLGELRGGGGGDALRAFFEKGSATIFAAPFDDVGDVLIPAPGPQRPGWEARIRDRLGLVHLNPRAWGVDIPIAVFLYRVRETPAVEGFPDERALVAPTQIDGALNAAYCPVPDPGVPGRTVALSSRGPHDPAREMLHARPRLGVPQLLCVGTLTEPPSDVAPARKDHIDWIRGTFNAPAFAADTDADL